MKCLESLCSKIRLSVKVRDERTQEICSRTKKMGPDRRTEHRRKNPRTRTELEHENLTDLSSLMKI